MTIFIVHGFYLNKTNYARRMVHAGYRDPTNRQLGGQLRAGPDRPSGAADRTTET